MTQDTPIQVPPTPSDLARDYQQGCREVAKSWLEVSDAVQHSDPDLARFALDRAIENYNTATGVVL